VLGVSREEFTGENRETYWKHIFGFKRVKTSKQKYAQASAKAME